MGRLSLLALLLLVGCGGEAVSTAVGPRFTDVTAGSGLDFRTTTGADPPRYLVDTIGTGVALIDYDRDGDIDVFAANGATPESPEAGPGARLFENLGGMRFRDVTEETGLDVTRWTFGLARGDFDNDGWPDLFLACYGENILLRNDQGRFVDVTAESGIAGSVWSATGAFGDFDADGDLDLYVVNYCEQDLTKPSPVREFTGVEVFAGPMGLGKVADVLYRNDGGGRFTDVSGPSGIHGRKPSWGLSAVVVDFDRDGNQDIYVGNDSTASFFFRGRGDGTFIEEGVKSGVGLSGSGGGQATMGIAVGDVDGNSRPDLFTTNFMYDTNTLHLNRSGGTFLDSTIAYGLQIDSRPFLGWATAFHDFDHDADEDLVFFNGNIYPRSLCELNGWDYDQVPVMYRREAKRFVRLTPEEGGDWLAAAYCDRAAAAGDLDGDGDLDLVVSPSNGPLRLLRNERDGGEWIQVRLEDRRPGRDPEAWGAEVVLHAGELVQRRWLANGKGYFSAEEPVLHFALPAGQAADRLEVRWPDGTVEEHPAPATGALTRIVRE